MKIAIINDVHFGIRDDSPIFHKHIEHFYTNQFFPTLKSKNIKTVICLGDMFDKRKAINIYTLDETKRYFFDVLAKEGIELIVLIGNHDTFYKSTNSINSPSHLLNDYKNITVYSECETIKLDNKPFDLIPWINKENYDSSLKFVNDSSSMVAFAHLELKDFVFQQGIVAQHGMDASLFEKYHSVLTGHYHSKSSNGNIHYLGCQYDLTWADYGEKKYFHIFDTDTFGVEEIENPKKMFIKLFYSDEAEGFEEELKVTDFSDLTNSCVKVIIRSRKNPVLFDLFMSKVNQSNPFDVVVVDEEELMSAGSNDVEILVGDTYSILKSSIDKADVKVDKTKLLRLMSDLYNEANSMS